MVWVGGGVRRRRLRQRLRVILQLPSCRRVRGPEMAFFDVETSMPQRADQGYALLEFGAVLVCPRRLVEVASYATLVRPADPVSAVSAASVRCNGITRDAVSGAPPFRDVADAVYDLLNGRVWAGHNIVRFCNVKTSRTPLHRILMSLPILLKLLPHGALNI